MLFTINKIIMGLFVSNIYCLC